MRLYIYIYILGRGGGEVVRKRNRRLISDTLALDETGLREIISLHETLRSD